MFRRKTKSKNSFLILNSSNRGSDIVRPENTSLIVNESDTEEGNFPKQLTSIFSEDEDENLGVTCRNTSSFMKSFSQKKQSTPLSQSQSQNRALTGRKNSVPRRANKISSVSKTESTYFMEVLKAGGAVPLPENSSFLLSEDQAVFSIKVNKKLKESAENVNRFVNSIKENIKDYKNLQKMLAHTLTSENCKAARGPVQQPLMRMLLNVECLQSDLIELLLKTVADCILDNKVESENIQFVSSILSQMKFLCRVNDIKIATKLLEILDMATVNVKREIIFLLPEIICEEEAEETCIQLIEMLKFDEVLTQVIIDALTNLPLTMDLRSLVCSKILHRLDKCPLEFLPSLVQFVLNKCHTEELIMVINGLRNNLPFSPQHYKMRMTKQRSEKTSLDENSYVKLTFESLKFSMMASKETTEAWIKIICGFNSSHDFRFYFETQFVGKMVCHSLFGNLSIGETCCKSNNMDIRKPWCVDLIMLIIFYSCLFGRKSQILQLIRNKIKSGVLTQNHVQNMFKILTVIAEEYSTTILEIASVLLKSFESKLPSFGSLFYKECFTHFHPYMKQIVISELSLHIGTGPSAAINIALYTLKELCDNQKQTLSHHTASIMGLLVNVTDLDSMQVRVLMDVIANLIFFEPCNSNAAMDELQIFIRKQLISSKSEQYKKGVSAAIMFGKHSAKEDNSEDPDHFHSSSLLELAMGSNGTSDIKRGFFNDEFAAMAKESRLSKSFLEIWSKRTFSLIMDNLFVKKINMECIDFPVSAQYSLQVENIQRFVFPVTELIIKSNNKTPTQVSVPVIPSTLKLLWCLERDLKKLLPLFCASVIMPEIAAYENFNGFDENQKKTLMDCLFLCANYLIECVNAFCALGILDKAVLRIKQLISVRKLIARNIGLIPEFSPPLCQFYLPTQKVLVKKKVSEKNVKKGRKRKLSEVEAETSSLLNESRRSGKTAGFSSENILPEEQAEHEADLFPYSCFFRELEFLTSKLLVTDLESSPDMYGSVNIELETRDVLFLLDDLIYKSEQILKSEQTFNSKSKPALLMQKMTPEEFIVMSVNILPGLLDKIEMYSKYCENLLEANDWVYDSRGLYTEDACHVKLAMAAGLKFIANIISWQGFHNSNDKLLKDILSILARRGGFSNKNSSLEPSGALAVAASKYFTSFSKTVLVLSGGLSIVKSFQACFRHSSIEPNSCLVDLCREFLCRDWYTVTGTPERGSVYNQHIDFLLKTYFSFVENEIEMVRVSAKTAFDERERLEGKNSTLKTFRTINKNNFPLLYRTICEALVSISAKEIANAGSNHEKQLQIWSKVVETLLILVGTAKLHSSRAILASLLKRSQSIIQLFLSKGMPVVESALRVKSVEVLTLLKSFQVVTRFLHSICCHSRVTNDSVVAAHVPAIRSICERLTFEVKGMLILNGIPMDCITIAILKNRDIKGNDIISQETSNEDSDDDSQLPPEDTPEVEENQDDSTSEQTRETNSEDY